MTTSTVEKPTAGKGKAGRPSKDAAADAVDLSGLSFTVAEKPKRKGTEPNPFTVPLGESYETETARATQVPAVALRRVEGMLRRAAGELSIGVTIAVESDEKGEPVVDADGRVTITFMGKDRRKRKGKGDAEPESPATDAENTPAENADAGTAATIPVGSDVPASGSESVPA